MVTVVGDYEGIPISTMISTFHYSFIKFLMVSTMCLGAPSVIALAVLQKGVLVFHSG